MPKVTQSQDLNPGPTDSKSHSPVIFKLHAVEPSGAWGRQGEGAEDVEEEAKGARLCPPFLTSLQTALVSVFCVRLV